MTYEDEHVPGLVKTLDDLSNENTEIFIGYELREMDAESIFYQELEKHNFTFEQVFQHFLLLLLPIL